MNKQIDWAKEESLEAAAMKSDMDVVTMADIKQAQKTASPGHNDVPHYTCHGGYTSLSTPTPIGCCYKRPPVQVKNPILHGQYIQRFLLLVKYQTVEPAARKADKC